MSYAAPRKHGRRARYVDTKVYTWWWRIFQLMRWLGWKHAWARLNKPQRIGGYNVRYDRLTNRIVARSGWYIKNVDLVQVTITPLEQEP